MSENIKSKVDNLTLKDVVMLLDYKGYFYDSYDIDNNTITFQRNSLPPITSFPSGVKKLNYAPWQTTIKIKYKTFNKVYKWVEELPFAIELDKWRTKYNSYLIGEASMSFDAHIADIVIELNRKGYITSTSCGGHFTGNDFTPIIIGFINSKTLPNMPYGVHNCKLRYDRAENIIKIFLNNITVEERDRVLNELLLWARNLPQNIDYLDYWQNNYDGIYDWNNITLIRSRPLSDLGDERWEVKTWHTETSKTI